MAVTYVWVLPADGKRVALTERHPDHPDGEAWVAGDELDPEKAKIPVKVALTDAVRAALNRGILLRAEVSQTALAVAASEPVENEIASPPPHRRRRQ